MQILITDDVFTRTRAVCFNKSQAAGVLAGLLVVMLLLSGTIYHFVFLAAAREGWPVVSQLVRLVVRDEIAQKDKYMRENLDAMAQKVGELQARMVHIESMGERVTGLAGVKAEDLKAMQRPVSGAAGRGGPFVPLDHPSLELLNQAIHRLDLLADQHGDLLTLAESRLFESRLRALMVPNSRPIEGAVGSGFGFRSDPFTGRPALHTGLDFSADIGTTILAAAGGVVSSTEFHPQYGNMLEIDHGSGLVTRYAHTSRYLVKAGDLVKRGQAVAQVGTSGRSTGPHLHFEVVVDGVPQDPAKFLAGGPAVAPGAPPRLQSVAGVVPAPAAAAAQPQAQAQAHLNTGPNAVANSVVNAGPNPGAPAGIVAQPSAPAGLTTIQQGASPRPLPGPVASPPAAAPPPRGASQPA